MRKRAVGAVLILVVLVMVYNLIKQISLALDAGGRLDKEADDLAKLQQENQRLRDRLGEVSQYSFVEQIARDKLNMSKPNETVVVIPDNAIAAVLGAEKKVEEVKLPNWQGWLKLIFH